MKGTPLVLNGLQIYLDKIKTQSTLDFPPKKFIFVSGYSAVHGTWDLEKNSISTRPSPKKNFTFLVQVLLLCYYFYWELCWHNHCTTLNKITRECIGIVVFCIRHYISRIRIHSILMEFLETSDCTNEFRKDETCLQFKMNKRYYIESYKISRKH